MVSQRKKTAFFLGSAVIAFLTVVVACSVDGRGSHQLYEHKPGVAVLAVGMIAIAAWAWLLDRFK